MIDPDRRAEYDSAKLLTRSVLIFLLILILFICGIIGIQILKNGEANTESWAALMGVVGWVTGIASVIYNARFGISKQSDDQNKVIAKQAETAAVAQAALAPLATSAAAPVVPAKAEVVNIASETTNVVDQSTDKGTTS